MNQVLTDAELWELTSCDNLDEGRAIEAAVLAKLQAQAEPVASIYINEAGAREFDDWRVKLPKGRNILYTAPPPAPAAPKKDATC